MKKITFVAAWLLTIVALLHLFRVFFPLPIIIGTLSIPQWMSCVVFLGAGTLSTYLFRASRTLPQ